MSHDPMNSDQYVLPSRDGGRLRACLSCKLVKAEDQWRDGCENCHNIFEMYGTAANWTTPSCMI